MTGHPVSETPPTIGIVGVPIDCGSRLDGCWRGPNALRRAGLATQLRRQGWEIRDYGNLRPPELVTSSHGARIPAEPGETHALAETALWAKHVRGVARRLFRQNFPIFLGGDHAMAHGTLPGLIDAAEHANIPLFVLWIDAHADAHTPRSSPSGNLHGTPLGYVLGRRRFDGLPLLRHRLRAERLCLFGVRAIDPGERRFFGEHPVEMVTPEDWRRGTSNLDRFLARVRSRGGHLHVSIDVDAFDPRCAPGVGTPVPGGLNEEEAQRAIKRLFESGVVASLELAEFNPFLDERGRTARFLVRLVSALIGPADANRHPAPSERRTA